MLCSLCYIVVFLLQTHQLESKTQPRVFTFLSDAQNHDVHVNDQRPQGIISCLEQAWFGAHATSSCRCQIFLVDGTSLHPNQTFMFFFLKAWFVSCYIAELSRRVDSRQTFTSSDAQNHDVHVNDQRPQGIIVMSWASMIWCPSYIAVVVSSMADPSDFFLEQLHTWAQPFHVLTDARNHDVHVNDQRPQGIISCLERAWFDAHATSLSLSRRWQTLQIFLDSFIFELRRFTSFQTLKIMTFMSTIHDHKTSYHVLSKHGLVSKVHRYHCHVVLTDARNHGRPIRYIRVFLEGFKPELRLSTFYQTLKIMMFMSTTNDHKASYHVLSEHDLAPKLHRCRCLNDGRPIRSFLKSSYWNSDVSRPYRRSKAWQIMTFMSTTNDHKASCHVLSKHDLVAKLHRCPCQVDGTPIRVFFFEGFKPELRLSTFYQTLEIMMFMSTTNDHKASYHVLSKQDLAPRLHRCRCLVDGRPIRSFLKASYTGTQNVSRPYRRSKSWQIMTFMSTTSDHEASCHVLSKHDLAANRCLARYIAVVVKSMAHPSDTSQSFYWRLQTLSLELFTFYQTLKIMMFMLTTNDQKASYHVLSKHDLAPMLHRCCCLVDVRPFRFFFDSFIFELRRFTSF